MSDEKDRGTESLVPPVGGEIVRQSTSLVRRGLNLVELRKPTEDTEIKQLREEFLNRYVKALAAQEPNEDARITKLRSVLTTGAGVPAWSLLAIQFTLGVGVPQDDEQAAHWYRKAAEQGDANAQCCLGGLYFYGQGVPQDDEQAVQWFRKAAEQGDDSSQATVGNMYVDGRGVQQDFVEAHRWLSLAAARASGADQQRFADERDAVAKKMTSDQLSEAQKRAREWMDASERRNQSDVKGPQ